MFPKVPDQHKVGQPLTPNGLGVLYVLFTTVYLFVIYFLNNPDVVADSSAPLILAACILFGGFMGLLDDWMDLKWRYKAFMPLIAALPLMYFAKTTQSRTSIFLPFFHTVTFPPALYYYIIIPVMVMIVTNVVNQLGGLNGLETICPSIVIIGLMALSPSPILMAGPLVFWLVLAYFNYSGKIFVGNSGSFAIGLTIVSFAVISNLKLSLLVSIVPYIFNAALILLSVFITKKRASLKFDGQKLSSDHRKSLVTLITYRRPMTERQVVAIVTIIFFIFMVLAIASQLY